MNKRIYAIIELILSGLLVAVGLFAIIKIEWLSDFITWVLVGFFVVRILLVLFRQLTFKPSRSYTAVQIILNTAVIVLMIVFREYSTALSYVVLASCAIDLVTNILKAISFRKKRDSESFFGIDNIICMLFIVLLFANRNNPAIATAVLFGSFVMYKGVTGILSNHYVRKLISLSDLGKTFNKVHALDVFFGLLIVLMLTSFILPYIEPGITNVGDAWWYCFALITTIGFGDFTCTTAVGRVLSVIIGFYGIIIVSLLTSSLIIYITSENEKEEKERRELEEKRQSSKVEKKAKKETEQEEKVETEEIKEIVKEETEQKAKEEKAKEKEVKKVAGKKDTKPKINKSKTKKAED